MSEAGARSARGDAAPSKGRWRWAIGCFFVPTAVVLILAMVTSTVSSIRSGRIVFWPELSTKVHWQAKGSGEYLRGGWHTGEALVYGDEEGLVAFDSENGGELWRLEPDSRLCGMSQQTQDGLGVVLLEGDIAKDDVVPPDLEDTPNSEPEADSRENPLEDAKEGAVACDVVLAVDTATGEELWRSDPLAKATSDSAHLLFSRGSHLEPVGGHVIARVGGEMLALDHDGEEVWRQDEVSSPDAVCPAADFLARDGNEVVLAGDCGIDESITIQVVDIATGEDTTEFEFPRGDSQSNQDRIANTVLVAADPIHVRIGLGHSDVPPRGEDVIAGEPAGAYFERTIAFDDNGGVRHELPVHWKPRDSAGSLSRPLPPFAVDDDRIYTTSGTTSCSDEVHAYDLATGEREWRTKVDDMGPRVVDVRDGRVLVVREGRDGECAMLTPDRDWQFSAVDAATGEEEVISPQMGGVGMAPDMVWWRGDRAYIINTLLSNTPGGIAAVG